MNKLEWMQALASTPLPLVVALGNSENAWIAFDAAQREHDNPADLLALALANGD